MAPGSATLLYLTAVLVVVPGEQDRDMFGYCKNLDAASYGCASSLLSKLVPYDNRRYIGAFRSRGRDTKNDLFKARRFLQRIKSACSIIVVFPDVLHYEDLCKRGEGELQAPAVVTAISEETSSSQQNSTPPPRLDIDPELPAPKRRQLVDLLAEYHDCFATSSKVRQTPMAKHRIITDDDALPVHQSPYRVSLKERKVIQDQVQEMLDDDIIQPSRSPWASPVVLVKKKDGTLRFCVDYRRLNAVTKKDVYPLPRIDDTLDRLRHSRYFSSMDLKSGYWQIEVDERDREKTAFVTPDGLYEFKVMPFGLCTAPATFQRVMDTVLAEMKLAQAEGGTTSSRVSKKHDDSKRRLQIIVSRYNGRNRLETLRGSSSGKRSSDR
ncbi:retrovirus-related Pol polyprotein from transposon 17.6 [Ixodes scapularis]